MACLCRHGSEAQVQLQTIRNLGGRSGWCGQHHAPADVTPGNTLNPLCRRPDGPQCKYRRVRKIRLHRHSIPGPFRP
jgi:hypothetical protein